MEHKNLKFDKEKCPTFSNTSIQKIKFEFYNYEE